MDDALLCSLKKLLKLTDDFETLMYSPLFVQQRYCKEKVDYYFNDFMSHLRSMMNGYENEEVWGLLKDMELKVDRINAPRVFKVSLILEICKELCNIRYGSTVETLLSNDDTVVDDLDSFLENLSKHIEDYEEKRYRLLSSEALEHRRKVSESFGALVDHLRKMMLGYEDERVRVLFEEMEQKIAHFVGPSLSDIILDICEKLFNIRYGSNTEREEIVGFDEEITALLDQLTATSTKQLQVISITGMAGLGKTTLARHLYSHPLIEYFFDIRAWICVSQEYRKRDLLLGILSSFISDFTDEIYEMSDEQLGEKIYRCVKGRKYLVVLDDIWSCKAWNDLKIYFPDDKIGSRVLFTSRDNDVSLHVGGATPAHVLRLRTANESWEIFQKKVFRIGITSDRLEIIGREISNKCEGLPLAIVVTAGLLKNNWSTSWWKEVSESLHSFMVRESSQYMDSLDLSYNHLPPSLRPCFVFVGVFPEDYDIPVTKLIWLWIAQGLIHETKSRTLEDVAQDILKGLINRSLLMTAKMTSDGRIKECHIHDLLRDLCLRKGKEENVSPQMYKNAPVLATTGTIASSSTISNMEHGISVHPPESTTQSVFCYPFELGKVLQVGEPILIETYKSLRILDVESILISLFPSVVIQLDNLRYLAIQAHDGSPQPSISNLVNLQMLIISSKKNIVLPKTIWNMINLRHLHIKSGENLIEEPCFLQATKKDGCLSGLFSLQTLSQVSPQSCRNIISRIPNLRKLGFCGPLISSQGDIEFPNIRSLEHLQKLKLLNTIPYPEPTRLLNTMMFPEKLKKLTLSNTGMDWDDMWAISLLPNLEVLKLKFHACIGKEWETSDTEFQQLRILKLNGLNLKKWVCSRDNFPCLQRLVIRHCSNLSSIPPDLGKICTLAAMEIQGCKKSVQVSALKIQEEQESGGDCFLKVHATNNI